MVNRRTVPPVEPDPVPPGGGEERFAAIELRLLDADAKAKENVNRESGQRFWLRWIAVGLACAVVGGMGWMLTHVVHHVLSLQRAGAPASFIIAIYVAPIISITTIALAMLVAAFRGFKDKDSANGASLAADAARATGVIN